MKVFSFLLPTRGNPALAKRFLQSACETADHPEQIEVVLGVDEDDPASHGIEQEGLCIKTLLLPAGLTMGSLNRACYEASSGRYVMLINDDVIVRTKGWDSTIYRVFARFHDDVALVHVNDLLFRERLCTFPILSRRACDAIGLCPGCYKRYRIDDHIGDTYHLLSYLGHNRRVYLEDVVFEHDNYAHSPPPVEDAASFFESREGKVYVPKPEVFEADSQAYNERLEERKSDARKLAGLIEQAAEERRQTAYAARLGGLKDSIGYRAQCPPPVALAKAPPVVGPQRVTVAVVTADIRQQHTRLCLSRLKEHTANFDLMVLDNHRSQNFSHPREMNRVLRTATTDFVALLDDDVFVTPGWLDGLVAAVNERTGIVTPLHKDRRGRMSYSGVYLLGDGTGRHAHTVDVPSAPRVAECMCSAAVLIDRRKCGDLFFEEAYRKYFLDLDYALRVWEAGYEVVVTPHSVVTHLGGGTMSYQSPESAAAVERDRATFVATWIAGGRLAQIERDSWAQYDFLGNLARLRKQIREVFDAAAQRSPEEMRRSVEPLMAAVVPFPLLYESIAARLFEYLPLWHARGDQARIAWAERLIERCRPVSPVRRIARRVKRRLVQTVKGQTLSRAKLTLGRIPGLRETVSATRRQIRQAYEHYRRLPVGVRRILDPAVVRAKRAFGPLLKPPIDLKAGMYKGYQLVQDGEVKRALPMPMPGAKPSAQNFRRVLTAQSLAQLTTAIDRLGAKPLGPDRLLTTHVGSMQPAAAGEYQGVRILAFEGRYFGLTNGHGFDPQTLRAEKHPSCLVGHSLDEIRTQVDELHRGKGHGERAPVKPRALVVCQDAVDQPPACLKSLNDHDVTLFVPEDYRGPSWGLKTRCFPRSVQGDYEYVNAAPNAAEADAEPPYDALVVPYSRERFWRGAGFERFAAAKARRLDVALPDGTSRSYRGEDIHRVIYNKAYLAALLRYTSVTGMRVLDVGCSDGLACDLLLNEDPAAVVGIDVMESVGCVYHHPRLSYAKMDAAHLEFPDESFDVCYSIATLEHCADPFQVLQEMKRVTKKGGLVSAQAGPLFYSPFGHHMFGYFDACPWIHLRKDLRGILDYARTHGIDEQIRRTLGRDPAEYVAGMLNTQHLNALAFQEYRIAEFIEAPDMSLVSLTRTSEGQDLLTAEVLAEAPGIVQEDLVGHGFELVFRRK